VWAAFSLMLAVVAVMMLVAAVMGVWLMSGVPDASSPDGTALGVAVAWASWLLSVLACSRPVQFGEYRVTMVAFLVWVAVGREGFGASFVGEDLRAEAHLTLLVADATGLFPLPTSCREGLRRALPRSARG
jgi:hypothetical protein